MGVHVHSVLCACGSDVRGLSCPDTSIARFLTFLIPFRGPKKMAHITGRSRLCLDAHGRSRLDGPRYRFHKSKVVHDLLTPSSKCMLYMIDQRSCIGSLRSLYLLRLVHLSWELPYPRIQAAALTWRCFFASIIVQNCGHSYAYRHPRVDGSQVQGRYQRGLGP